MFSLEISNSLFLGDKTQIRHFQEGAQDPPAIDVLLNAWGWYLGASEMSRVHAESNRIPALHINSKHLWKCYQQTVTWFVSMGDWSECQRGRHSLS